MSDDKKSKTPKDTHYANLRRAFRDQKAGGNKTDGGKSAAASRAARLPSARASPWHPARPRPKGW